MAKRGERRQLSKLPSSSAKPGGKRSSWTAKNLFYGVLEETRQVLECEENEKSDQQDDKRYNDPFERFCFDPSPRDHFPKRQADVTAVENGNGEQIEHP